MSDSELQRQPEVFVKTSYSNVNAQESSFAAMASTCFLTVAAPVRSLGAISGERAAQALGHSSTACAAATPARRSFQQFEGLRGEGSFGALHSLCAISPKSNRVVTAAYDPAKNLRSEGFWTPADSVVANSIWSIRNDLEVPSSIYAQGGQGPPPMLMERFQSVITQLFQHRIIRCGGAVDDDMANLIVAQLLYLDAADPNRDIVMYVNSPGGSVTAGMAVFDTMRHIRPDVSTVCVGLAASMGAFLLSAGTKGKRYSLPNSRIMIHQPLGGAQGQQTDIEIQANEILHHKANLNGYLAYHTGQPLEKIVQDTDRDFFMSAKEAKEYGLIDAVISNPLKALPPLPAPVPA